MSLNLAVIFAGGSGVRMNSGSKPKQFLVYKGKPIIIYTLELFDSHPDIDGIVVACIQNWIPTLEDQLEHFGIQKVVKVVPGGRTGQESIYNALCAAETYAEGRDTVVLIHDGVRPLITHKVIRENIAAVERFGNCITCVPAIETFIIEKKDNLLEIPDRNSVLVARAPQSFFIKDILSAHRRARTDNLYFIDCCTMMSYYGHHLHTIIGPVENIKITTPIDFILFKALIEADKDPQIALL